LKTDLVVVGSDLLVQGDILPGARDKDGADPKQAGPCCAADRRKGNVSKDWHL
jgi:hypothetical protein